MVTETFKFWFDLELEPISSTADPYITVWLNDHVVYNGPLLSSTLISYETTLPLGNHNIQIVFSKKSDLDTDQAIRITRLNINNICDSKFIWAGKYQPLYPEPWATQQRNQGITLLPVVTGVDYLGWNGTWRLDFTSPAFTWIHQTCDLGWIYS